ncbi:MAG: hypothetical protein P1V51_23220 [Deltaproteobacteria bacterium]|nr:hypothetical protein [Deltaproteobacteria bacterium]
MSWRICSLFVLLSALPGCGRDFEMPGLLPQGLIGCGIDADCDGGRHCQGATSTTEAVCFPTSIIGLPGQGDPSALDYRDNLPHLREWAEETYGLGPPELVMINGAHLGAEGTIDLGAGATASWTYQLRLGDSGRYLTVVYYLYEYAAENLSVPLGILGIGTVTATLSNALGHSLSADPVTGQGSTICN